MENQQEDRNLTRSLIRGGKLRCPNCSEGKLFKSYLKPVETCGTCDEDMSHQRADDLPAYLTIFLVGHIVLPLIVLVYKIYPQMWDVSMVFQIGLWIPILTLSTLITLPFVKGAVIGLQWALRMHGFGGKEDEIDFGDLSQ